MFRKGKSEMIPIAVVMLAVLLTVLVLSAVAQDRETQRLTPEEFAILAWGDVPADRELVRGLYDCGCNLAGIVPIERLDMIREAGLKCFLFDPSIHVLDAEAALDEAEIERRVKAVLAKTGNHPAVFGYYLRDEPAASLFPGLGKWMAAFRKLAPRTPGYINLFPNYASPAQLGTQTYEEHLERYLTTVKPSVLCYDHYALMEDGTLREGYFQNLESIRTASLKHSVPFWNVVLANAHFHYAEPTPAGFRFQVYTTLAYGARGIAYFTYFAPAIGNYRLAPVDQFGHRTPTWDMLRNVNLQIHRIGPAYLKLKSVNVFHHPNVPHSCQGIGSARHVAEIAGGDLLVGEFEGPDGSPWVMVVNKDLHRSTAFSVRFKQAGTVRLINPYTGREEPLAGEHNWLAAGQGLLLHLAK